MPQTSRAQSFTSWASLCVALALSGFFSFACSSNPTENRTQVFFADPQLEQAIGAVLGKTGQPLYQDETLQVSRLECENCGVSSLGGIEQLANLERLDLGENEITDVAVLGKLKKLHTLYMFGNPLTEFDSLVELSALRDLRLGASAISDLPPLAGLAGLEQFYLNSCGVSDIAELSKLSALERLVIFDNDVHDIAALAELTSLRYVNLYANDISDLNPLVQNSGMGVGDTLVLFGNPLSGVQVESQIEALQSRGVVVMRSLDRQIHDLPEIVCEAFVR